MTWWTGRRRGACVVGFGLLCVLVTGAASAAVHVGKGPRATFDGNVCAVVVPLGLPTGLANRCKPHVLDGLPAPTRDAPEGMRYQAQAGKFDPTAETAYLDMTVYERHGTPGVQGSQQRAFESDEAEFAKNNHLRADVVRVGRWARVLGDAGDIATTVYFESGRYGVVLELVYAVMSPMGRQQAQRTELVDLAKKLAAKFAHLAPSD